MVDFSRNSKVAGNGSYSERYRQYVVRKLLEFQLKHPSRRGKRPHAQAQAQNSSDAGQETGVGQLGKEEQGIIGVKAQYQERQKKGKGKEVETDAKVSDEKSGYRATVGRESWE